MRLSFPKTKLTIQRLFPTERVATLQGDGSCGTCHLAGVCPPNERCGVVVKVRERDGAMADVLCWPADSWKRAA